MDHPILCFGEVLWDALPAGLFLGGAPLNVACHLNELGVPVVFASRVGDDELGREIVRRLQRRGIATDLLQTDPELETGFVIVELDPAGSPSFEIVHPSAWDGIEPEPALLAAAQQAPALVYGSLAQRSPTSRATLQRLLDAPDLKAFDVNLRPPFDDRQVVEETLARSDLVKLNDDEMRRLAAWFGLDSDLERSARQLAARCSCPTVCVTRGARGAALLHEDRWYDHPGFSVQVVDAVGSGDAFLAALLQGLLTGADPAATLARANAVGAYVATRNGATPEHEAEAIEV